MNPSLILLLACSLSACSAGPAAEANPVTARAAQPQARADAQAMRVTTIASGLDHPWAVGLLPDGGFLVTERSGNLRRISASGELSAPLAGVPAVWAHGQGGLLDVVLAPDFERSHRI